MNIHEAGHRIISVPPACAPSFHYRFFVFFSYQIFSEGFVGGTLVTTTAGTAPIETLQQHDFITAYAVSAERFAAQEVMRAHQLSASKLVHLHVGDIRISCAPDQRFYVPECRQWMRAQHMDVGTHLLCVSGELVAITAIDHEKVSTMVYALTVVKQHT